MRYLLCIFFLGVVVNSYSQIEVIRSDEVYLIGEVNAKMHSVGSDAALFVSLSYSKTDKGNLYKLQFREENGYLSKIEFYATPKEIENLYQLILNDFQKPPGEFETVISLGEEVIKIRTDFLEMEISANIGKSPKRLTFYSGKRKIFSLNQEELKSLFNRV